MVDLGGRPTPVKVAHLRLCYSRVFLAVAYLREAQEMVFDAHWRAFSLWGGSCQRGIYDNLKTAVELIFIGKARQYNRKFLQMASHYLIEPVACTPAAGWEKGQVENQVGHVRENIFTPRQWPDAQRLNCRMPGSHPTCHVFAGTDHPSPRVAPQRNGERNGFGNRPGLKPERIGKPTLANSQIGQKRSRHSNPGSSRSSARTSFDRSSAL